MQGSTRVMAGALALAWISGALGASTADVYGSRRSAARPAQQYQSQDPKSGAYQYGYSGPHHAKSESSVNGVTRGGYSYIDSNGQLQTISYTADAENGFRIQASNLPSRNSLVPVQDTPEVALAKKRHLDQLRRAESISSSWQQQQQQPQSQQEFLQPQQQQQLQELQQPQYQPRSQRYQQQIQQELQQQQQQQPQLREQQYQPRSQRYQQQRPKSRHLFLLDPEEVRAIAAPRPSNAIVVDAAPDHLVRDEPMMSPHRGFSVSSSSHHVLLPTATAAAASVIVPVLPVIHTSMRHSQDTLGQYEYSYTGDTSAKTESRSLDGTTRGAYSYIDANGLLQQVHYVADKDGFRVLATNLPGA